MSYDTPEFGTLSEREITYTLEHIFGAKTKRVNGIRMLSFDLAKLERLSRIYDLSTVYKCKECSDSPEYYDLKGIEESHFKPFHTGKYKKN